MIQRINYETIKDGFFESDKWEEFEDHDEQHLILMGNEFFLHNGELNIFVDYGFESLSVKDKEWIEIVAIVLEEEKLEELFDS